MPAHPVRAIARASDRTLSIAALFPTSTTPRKSPADHSSANQTRDEPGWVTFGIDGHFAYASTGEVIDAMLAPIVFLGRSESRIFENVLAVVTLGLAWGRELSPIAVIVVGNLFGQKSHSSVKSELVILLKPLVVESDEQWAEEVRHRQLQVQELQDQQRSWWN